MNGTRQGNHTEGVRTMTRFNTQLVHGLPVNDNNTGAVNPPIYNSSTYAFESVEAMPRWDYARSGNPTREFLEKQIAQLEHGTRGFAFGSGLAAIHAVLSIFQPGDRIVVGIDAKDGIVAVDGWGVSGDVEATALAKEMKKAGVKTIIYTDISRDGTLSGVNVEATAKLARESGVAVVASGGVKSIADIEALKPYEKAGIEGVIVGKSIYMGMLDLAEAIEIAAKEG